jgi:hypothetical protein
VSSLSAGMPSDVRKVRRFLKDEFESLIYTADFEGGETPGNEQRLISRALTAFVARRLLSCTSDEAAAAVVDGNRDNGIDGIAIAVTEDQIWLIQSKWSDQAKARFLLEDALKLKEGFELLDTREFLRFNDRVRDRADQIERAWDTPGAKVTLVIAVMGTTGAHPAALERLDAAKATVNGNFPDFLDYEIWDLARICQEVRDDYTEPSVEVVAPLTEWGKGPKSIESYQGMISVADVAEWYTQHGPRLFDRNIRHPLGRTLTNNKMIDTLVKAPADFWYFNNGITVLCDSADLHQKSRSVYSPCELTLKGASVVNGAQTVAAIHKAMQDDPGMAGQATVSLKVIITKDPDFSTAVTKATNTQNEVKTEDFVALDMVQRRLRQDFAVYLKKEYVYRRSEPVPTPEAGTSVSEVAMALACADSNPELAARARINRETLWEREPGGTYRVLFLDATPDAYRAWHAVQILRRAQAWLAETRPSREGRASAIADYGDLLVVHLVFQQLSLNLIGEPEYDLATALSSVPDLATKALSWLIQRTDAQLGRDSALRTAFGNVEQCRTLAVLTLNDLRTNVSVPKLPTEYRIVEVPRRPNAVTTLIDAGRIPEGTKIIFRPRSAREHHWVDPWIAGNPQRAEATWVNSRSKPLLWAYDGERYSPTRLVTMIWAATGWPDHPVAVQGPSQWYPEDGKASLWDLARAIQDEPYADDAEG